MAKASRTMAGRGTPRGFLLQSAPGRANSGPGSPRRPRHGRPRRGSVPVPDELVARGGLGAGLELEDSLDLDGDPEGQGSHADRRAGVTPPLGAEDLDEQVGGAVRDGRL